jgi:uncharacterized protein (DUF1015 family)
MLKAQFPRRGEYQVAIVHPFRALRTPVARVQEVASPPYDVVNTREARALAENNPFSFFHVSRAEIDLPEGTDLHSDAVYAKAAENFQKLIEECPLEIEAEPSLYLYRLVMGEQEQIGVVACASVDEYDDDLIRKHEKTRPDKEDDRTRHMLTLRAQTGPVFLTYRAENEIDRLAEADVKADPLYDFTAPDGIRHTVWRVQNPSRYVGAFRAVPLMYIADGHHRAASASRARATLREKNSGHTGTEDYNYFLTVIFPDNQLRILPYNRIVRDLNGLSTEAFLAKVRERFDVTEEASASPERPGQWSMYLAGRWYGLMRKAGDSIPSNPVEALDVSVLQDKLLDPVLGIKDVRTDKRIDFVGGIRGTDELERLVNDGKAVVAFSLFATSIEDLLRVSDAGGIMPPKSTWFEPKLRDGILIHTI